MLIYNVTHQYSRLYQWVQHCHIALWRSCEDVAVSWGLSTSCSTGQECRLCRSTSFLSTNIASSFLAISLSFSVSSLSFSVSSLSFLVSSLFFLVHSLSISLISRCNFKIKPFCRVVYMDKVSATKSHVHTNSIVCMYCIIVHKTWVNRVRIMLLSQVWSGLKCTIVK